MTSMHDVDVVVIGAGFAGLRSLHTLRSQGYSVAVLEAGGGIGGVWYWNRYPGARCDVESYDYSYSFSEELEQEWRWSERYATQPEILRYIEHVADRFDLRKDIYLNQRMMNATWLERDERWLVETDTTEQWSARFLIMAVGNLSTTKAPELPGQEDFHGEIYHSALWPHHEVDLTGKRVAIIGTGSSGMQMTPIIAQQASHLYVFQRTANFSVPAANALVGDEEDAQVKARYRQRREAARNSPSGLGFTPSKESALEVSDEERRKSFEVAWGRLGFGFALVYRDLLLDEKANETAADFIRSKIGELVEDPNVRELLTPRDFPFGTKRPSVDSGYFSTFNRSNVTLVNLRAESITGLADHALLTTRASYPLDVLIYATGFDAITGSLLRPEITGRNGVTLRSHWSAGPRTYLGPFVAGFPNFFIIAGPGSPSLLSNVLLSIEQHVDWITGVISHLQSSGFSTVEATPEAEEDWVHHVNERAAETLYPRAQSYYMGDEIPGKPRVFMPYSGGVRGYRRILERVTQNNFEGLVFQASASTPA